MWKLAYEFCLISYSYSLNIGNRKEYNGNKNDQAKGLGWWFGVGQRVNQNNGVNVFKLPSLVNSGHRYADGNTEPCREFHRKIFHFKICENDLIFVQLTHASSYIFIRTQLEYNVQFFVTELLKEYREIRQRSITDYSNTSK